MLFAVAERLVSLDMPSDLWEKRVRTFERKFSQFCQYHRRSLKVHWVHQQGGENMRAKFTGKSSKCTLQAECAPPTQSKSRFFRKFGELDGGSG